MLTVNLKLILTLHTCCLVPHTFSLFCSPRGVNYTSERNEDFYQISVEVKGMGTLQRSLDDYVKVRPRLLCSVVVLFPKCWP
jgi:hypothetical protein